MANLYLVDEHTAEHALALAKADPGAKVVLIQDGVYLDAADLTGAGVEVFAVGQDVEKRGMDGLLTPGVRVIGYGELVDLIAGSKVINFA